MSIIVLEGCDCVGKTTFAEMLSEKTGYEIVKGSSFEISELGADGMFEHMMDLLDRDNIIIDRFFYSNLVYGKIFDYPMMSPAQYDSLVEKLDKKALLLYLHTSEGAIQYRMKKRGDDMIKAENIGDILLEYKEVIYGDFRPKMMLSLDTTSSNIDMATFMVNEIRENIEAYIKNG